VPCLKWVTGWKIEWFGIASFRSRNFCTQPLTPIPMSWSWKLRTAVLVFVLLFPYNGLRTQAQVDGGAGCGAFLQPPDTSGGVRVLSCSPESPSANHAWSKFFIGLDSHLPNASPFAPSGTVKRIRVAVHVWGNGTLGSN